MDEVTNGGSRRLIQRRACRKDGMTKARRQRFLDTLARTCNVCMAAKAAGAGISTVYVLRRRDPAFAALWQEALIAGYERLEEALLSHALQGINDITIAHYEDAADADDQSADATARARPGSGVTDMRPSTAAVQLALALLNRHRASVEGRPARGGKRPKRSTIEETDAALRKKLDMMARRLKGDQ